MRFAREFWGELIGTALLVFFGCGSVAVTVLFGTHAGLFQVASVWGLGVTLAIYATRHLSCAHLNPAVSLAMCVGHRMSFRRLPIYFSAQLIGAFLSAALLYGLFSGSIVAYEAIHHIVRGTPDSIRTAMIFGDYFPNPGAGPAVRVSMLTAFGAEATGTFVLVMLVFSLTEGCNVGRPDDRLAPMFIGASVTALICVLAPLTQAGLNPARDLAPRLLAWCAGWGPAAFPDRQFGGLAVYVVAPLLGGAVAAVIFERLVAPMMATKPDELTCC